MLVMGVGVLVTVGAAGDGARQAEAGLSRQRARAGPEADPGHGVLESVLDRRAPAVAIVVFGVWFLLFAGASPIPGMNIQ